MSTEQLGEIRREFKAGIENLVAGIIMGVLMMGVGCVAIYFCVTTALESADKLPFWTKEGEKGWSWGTLGFFVAVGLGLVIGGFFLIRWVRSLSTLRVRIGANGFSVTDKHRSDFFAWEGIAAIIEIHFYQRPPLLKGAAKYALPEMMSKTYAVRMKDREGFSFDGNAIKGHNKLARMIKEETDKRNIPWEITEQHH